MTDKFNIMENATAHFKDQLSGGLLSIEVPEWSATIWFKPAFTFAQQEKIIQLSNDGKMVEAMIETLIVRSLDKDGKRLFTHASKTRLMNEVDPNIIIRVVGEMNQDQRRRRGKAVKEKDLYFIFFLAEQLGRSAEWIMNNISTTELRGWTHYYTIKNQKSN